MSNQHRSSLTDDLSAPAPARLLEARNLMLIAMPLAAAYLAEFAIALTTKSIVGQLGYLELAAIGLATDTTAEVIVVLVGFLSVVGVLVAQAEGADRKADAGLAARQGLILATAFGVAATVLVRNFDVLLSYMDQEPEVLAIMSDFLVPLSWSILPVLWFFALRTFVAALAKTSAILAITLVAVALNYVLTVGLVHGGFGLPALGVAGAGWSKTVIAWVMFLALLAYAYLTPTFRGYGLFRGRLRVDPALCLEIARLGVPVAGIVILEASLFMAVAVFSGQLGGIALASYQVMMAWIGIAFVTAHGLAEAGMVRVAHGIGRQSMASSRQAGVLTFGIGIAWLIGLSAIPLGYPELLVRMFLNVDDPGFDALLSLTTQLLLLAAFFQVFDGLQVMASLALRGLKDTIVPLWLAGLGYWVFGIAGGWLLAFPLEMGAHGLWWGMAAGLTVTGSLLATRFILLTAHRVQAA